MNPVSRQKVSDGIFAGAGDGWHTSDRNFNVCNIGINVNREITITDQFSLPVSGSAILNPDTDQYYLLLGFPYRYTVFLEFSGSI